MITQVNRLSLLASTILGGMVCVAFSATHAVAAAAAASSAEVSEIVVTGSRIPQPNLTSVSSVQVVDEKEIKLQGKTDAVDLINQLPQNAMNSQADFSNTSNPLVAPGGTSTADLRGLGPQRTLVLVNSRRLGVGDANTGNNNPAPDLNQIPLALVDHVEVLTGGASATYGSDAVAGVVNFVMKHDFQGVQIDGQFGVDQHTNHNGFVAAAETAAGIANPKHNVWDGRKEDLSLILGGNFEDNKGNVTVYLNYHKQDPVEQGSRDYSGCLLVHTDDSHAICAGSSNSNKFVEISGPTGQQSLTVIGDQFVPFGTAPAHAGSPGKSFNSSPYEYLLHGDNRYSAGYFAHYDLSQNLSIYSEFSLMSDRTITEVAPAGLFQGTGSSPSSGFLINCNNPLLSAQQANTICTPAEVASGANKDFVIGRRNIEGGPRHFEYDHDNYRAVLGARGDIPGIDGFAYDVYGSYYYTSLFQANDDFPSVTRIQNALQVVNVNGTPTCTSVVNGSDKACVPYNIFKQGGVTKAALDYLTESGTEKGLLTESIVQANLTGELGKYGIKSPWADEGFGVAVGVEHRRTTYDFNPDQTSLSGDLSGFGGASSAINTALGVTEGYGEVRAPIAHNLDFIHDLVFDAGYRYSHYTTGVTADTYKVGLQWAPTEDIRFRASFNRAIRAPNIVELFNPPVVTNSQSLSVDPCAPTAGAGGAVIPATATFAQCQRTGVTLAQYGNGGTTDTILQCPAGQCATTTGGNTALQPERSNTYSVGLTFTPRFLPGFVGSIDYYNIKINGLISNVPNPVTLNNCLSTGDPAACSNIVRTPSGFLFGTSIAGGGYVGALAANLGQTINSGIDIQASYHVPLSSWGLPDEGQLSFNFVGSSLLESKVVPVPGSPQYDCAGLYGPVCQTVLPKWRHTFRASWETPWDALVSLQWRYIGRVSLDQNTSQVGLSSGDHDGFDATIPAISYIDLSGSWQVRPGLVLRAGINNIFDKDPKPLDQSLIGVGLPNTYPTYDLLGRTMFVAFSAKF